MKKYIRLMAIISIAMISRVEAASSDPELFRGESIFKSPANPFYPLSTRRILIPGLARRLEEEKSGKILLNAFDRHDNKCQLFFNRYNGYGPSTGIRSFISEAIINDDYISLNLGVLQSDTQTVSNGSIGGHAILLFEIFLPDGRSSVNQEVRWAHLHLNMHDIKLADTANTVPEWLISYKMIPNTEWQICKDKTRILRKWYINREQLSMAEVYMKSTVEVMARELPSGSYLIGKPNFVPDRLAVKDMNCLLFCEGVLRSMNLYSECLSRARIPALERHMEEAEFERPGLKRVGLEATDNIAASIIASVVSRDESELEKLEKEAYRAFTAGLVEDRLRLLGMEAEGRKLEQLKATAVMIGRAGRNLGLAACYSLNRMGESAGQSIIDSVPTEDHSITADAKVLAGRTVKAAGRAAGGAVGIVGAVGGAVYHGAVGAYEFAGEAISSYWPFK